MNAKEELITAVREKTVAFGRVSIEKFHRKTIIDVKFENHSEYLESLDKLDIYYDSGYGGQELFGTVVFTDGTWIDRGEYDGSEWWRYHETPTKEEVFEGDNR